MCRLNGIQAIEWGGDVHVPPGTNAADVKKLASICEAAGISTPSYGSYFNVLDDEASSFSPVLETAVELGADTIRIWPGWVEPGEISAEQREKITTTTRSIAGISSDRGGESRVRISPAFPDKRVRPMRLKLLRAVPTRTFTVIISSCRRWTAKER